MANADPIVIVAAARTPMGGFQGEFKDLAAPNLGCALSAGQGQAPARQAALAAGLPEAVPCATVNKMCGSGMKAIMLAHDILCAGSARIALAGGMESMSNAPYLLDRARSGYRMG